MEEVGVVGLGLAKNFIQLCAMTRDGEIVEERRVRRDKLLSRLARYRSCCVAMEACGGAPYTKER